MDKVFIDCIDGLGQSRDKVDRLRVLADDPSWQVRFGVAEDPHAGQEILSKLSNDNHPQVRLQALRTINGEPTRLRHRIGVGLCMARERKGISINKMAEELSRVSGKSVRYSSYKDIEEASKACTLDTLETIFKVLGVQGLMMVDDDNGVDK